MSSNVNFSLGQGFQALTAAAQSFEKEDVLSHASVALVSQRVLGPDVKETASAAAASVPPNPGMTAEAWKTLTSLFDENFIVSKHPVTLEQLRCFSLDQVFEISYVSLLMSIFDKFPYSDVHYEATLAIINSISAKAWKEDQIKKCFFELIKAIPSNTLHNGWVSTIIKYLGALENLAMQSISSSFFNPNMEVRSGVMQFVRELTYKYGQLALLIQPHLQKNLETFLNQILLAKKNIHIVKAEVKAGTLPGMNGTPHYKKVAHAKSNDLIKKFENISIWQNRLCFCAGVIMKGFQRQIQSLTFAATDQSNVTEIGLVQKRFYTGFEKRIQKLSSIFVDFENSESIYQRAYLSTDSKSFLEHFYVVLDINRLLLAEGITIAVRQIPYFSTTLDKIKEIKQVEWIKKIYVSIALFVSHWLIENAPSYAKSKLVKFEESLLRIKLAEKQFRITYEQAKVEFPQFAITIQNLCETFYQRGIGIAEKFSGTGESAPLLREYIVNHVHSDIIKVIPNVLFEFAATSELKKLRIDKIGWKTQLASETLFKVLEFVLQNARQPEYDDAQLQLYPEKKFILYKCFFNAKKDLNNFSGLESLRNTLVSLLVSCQSKITASANDSSNQNWFEEIVERDNEDIDIIPSSNSALKQDQKTASIAISKPKVKFRGVKKAGNVPEFSASTHASRADRFLSVFKQKIYKVYGVSRDIVPASFVGQNVSRAKVSAHQHLQAVECLQVVREMQELTSDPDVLQLIETALLPLYGHLSSEQAMTLPDVEQFPSVKRTHRLDTMNARLKLNAVVGQFSSGVIGTALIRYPQCYAAKTKENSEQNAKESSQDMEKLINALVELQFKALEKCSFNTAQASLSLYTLWKESETKAAEGIKSAKFTFSKENLEKLTRAFGELNISILELDKQIQALTATVDEKTLLALKNVRSHLMNLRRLTVISPQFAKQRYLFVLAHMGVISTQYLAENLGLFLSLKDGLDPREHNLLFYYVSQSLGEGISHVEWETFKDINVSKGSEYLYHYFSTHEKSQISPVMSHLSVLYGASLQASSSATAASSSLSLDEMHKEFITHLINQIQLSNSLVSYHLK